MTILTVVNDVCAVVGVRRQASLFAASADPRTQFEMLGLANEMAQRIAYDGREWGALKNIAVVTGGVGDNVIILSGAAGYEQSFSLPADYKRLLLNSNVWRSTSTMMPMRFMPDTDEWTTRRYMGYYDQRGEWTIHRGKLRIAPPLQATFPDPANFPAWQNGHPYFVLGDYAKDTFDNTLWKVMVSHTSANSGTFLQDRTNNPTYWASVPITPAQSAHFNYLSKNCVTLNGGGTGDAFIGDNDAFLLPERLLKLGMIWQWKANKGSPYAEDMATFEEALARERGSDKPSPIISGPNTAPWNATVAYPYPTPTSADWAWPLR